MTLLVSSLSCLLTNTSNNCKLGECVRWGGAGWVVSGSGKGVQNMNISSCPYQCYCLPSHFTIRYYFIFPQKCKSVVLYFLLLLG